MQDALIPNAKKPFLRRIKIRNYKSIGQCDVSLMALTILVGRNGAGKSNFLDALRFVVDGLQTSLDHAFKSRGGIDAVRRISTGHPRNFALEIDLDLPNWTIGRYGFEISARRKGGFSVGREHLNIRSLGGDVLASYQLEGGEIRNASESTMPPSSADRLYLVTASSLPQFRTVYDALLSMGFYNLNPAAMKELQSPDAGELLHRDGSNISSVIERLAADEPDIKKRIKSYLETIVPDITDVSRKALGPRETLLFRQKVVGSKHPWTFFANSMSDGTLRALGALVAVTQLAERKRRASLVGIEEPETALHPAAAGALMDALREASSQTQIVVTTHSPDLLDEVDIDKDGLLSVVSEQGNTRIAPIDRANVKAIKDHLYSPGELLRMDQLEPDRDDLARQTQLVLFDDDEDQM